MRCEAEESSEENSSRSKGRHRIVSDHEGNQEDRQKEKQCCYQPDSRIRLTFKFVDLQMHEMQRSASMRGIGLLLSTQHARTTQRINSLHNTFNCSIF